MFHSSAGKGYRFFSPNMRTGQTPGRVDDGLMGLRLLKSPLAMGLPRIVAHDSWDDGCFYDVGLYYTLCILRIVMLYRNPMESLTVTSGTRREGVQKHYVSSLPTWGSPEMGVPAACSLQQPRSWWWMLDVSGRGCSVFQQKHPQVSEEKDRRPRKVGGFDGESRRSQRYCIYYGTVHVISYWLVVWNIFVFPYNYWE